MTMNHKRRMHRTGFETSTDGQQPHPGDSLRTTRDVHALVYVHLQLCKYPFDARDAIDRIGHTEDGGVVHAAHRGGEKLVDVAQHLMSRHGTVRVGAQTSAARLKVGRVHDDYVGFCARKHARIPDVRTHAKSTAALQKVVLQILSHAGIRFHRVEGVDIVPHERKREPDDAGTRTKIQHTKALIERRRIARGPGGQQKCVQSKSVPAGWLANTQLVAKKQLVGP